MPWPMRFGPAAEDDHLALVGRPRLALVLVRRVQVRRVRLELGGARVDALVDRAHAGGVARRADLRLGRAGQRRDPAIADAEPLVAAQLGAERRRRSCPRATVSASAIVAHVVEEPRIDPRQLVRALDRQAELERRGRPGTAGRATAIAIARSIAGEVVAERRHRQVEAGAAGLERADRLAERLAERAADRHRLADRLHLRAEHGLSPTGTSRTRSAATSRRRSRSSARTTPA